jgi:hypothetical protein
MKNLLLVCCLSFLAASAVAQSSVFSPECLDNSYAPDAARALAVVSNLETGNNAANAFNQMWPIFNAITGPRVSLFYGISSNGNFYTLEDCSSPVFNGYSPCAGQAGLVFGWKSWQAYGDNMIHYFAVTPEGTVNTFANQLVAVGPFFVTSQHWFRPLRSGWNDGELAPGSPLLSVDGTVYNAGFVTGSAGANRFNGEACGSCLTGSFPFAWSPGYAQIPTGSRATTEEEVQVAGKAIIDYVRGMTEEIFLEAYVGFDDGTFYDIGDCRHSAHGCPANSTYVFFIRNDDVYPPGRLNEVYTDPEGVFTTPVFVEDDYDPRIRPWYILGNGWSRFVSETTNETILGFSADFQGGVVASEINLGIRGTCEEGRNGEYDPSFYCAGNSLVATLAFVFASLAVMMF